MRLRAGLVAGFAAGVYVATIAQRRSRQLNQQLNQRLDRSVRRPMLDAATEKAKAAVDMGLERARDAVAKKLANPAVLRPSIDAPARPAAAQHNGGRPT